MQGLIGQKIGMTRVFYEDSGEVVPVTIIKIGKNVVVQKKTKEKDGYDAIQLGFGEVKETKLTKPVLGHLKRHGSPAVKVLKEFNTDSSDGEIKSGDKVGVEIFKSVKYVDVVGKSKGRGFAGTVKRYNFHIGRQTHGNTNRRERGSLGAGTYPARVFPGLKMAGHYGNEQVTVKKLEIVGVDEKNGLLYIKGAVPGANKGIVYVKKSGN